MAIYIIYYLVLIFLYEFTDRYILTWGRKNALTPQYAYSGRKESKEKVYVGTATLLLILMIGLRSQDMGRDLIGYLPGFDRISFYSWDQVFAPGLTGAYQNYEVGYVALNKLVSVLGGDRQAFLFSCAFFSLYPIGRMIYSYSKDTRMSFVIYLGLPCFMLIFSGLRQAIGIAITFTSYRFIKEKKLISFLLTIFVATLFHATAYIFVIAYPIYHVKLNKSIAIGSIALLPVVWLLKTPLFLLLFRLFKDNAVIDNNGAVTLFIVFSLVYVFSVVFGDRERPEINGLSNLFFIACCIQALGGVFSTVMRVGYYFMIYLALLLPEVLAGLKKNKIMPYKQIQLVQLIVLLCFALFGLDSLRNSSFAESYPYYFFWEN